MLSRGVIRLQNLKVTPALGRVGTMQGHRVTMHKVWGTQPGPRRGTRLMMKHSNRVTFQVGLGLVWQGGMNGRSS